MFGGYRQPQQEARTHRGEDLFIEVTVNRKDLGTTRVLEYDIQDACSGMQRRRRRQELQNNHLPNLQRRGSSSPASGVDLEFFPLS